jgi:hypothetical protein
MFPYLYTLLSESENIIHEGLNLCLRKILYLIFHLFE